MTSKDLLEDLKNSIKANIYENVSFKQKYGISNAEMNSLLKNCKSDYLNKILLEPILKILDVKELRILEKVLVDIIPMASINACAKRADNGEYLVVINERLMALVYSWNELQIHSVLKLGPESDTTDFSKNFSPILDCYLNPFSGKTLPIFNFEELPPKYQFVTLLRTIMNEQFILAHELAHVYLGHVDQVNENNMINGEFWDTFYAQNDTQQMEFDADIQAVKWLLLLSKSKCDINPLQTEIFFFIDVFSVFNLIECNIGFPTKNATHPSTIARLKNIKDYFGSDVFSTKEYSIDDMLENFKDISSFKIV